MSAARIIVPRVQAAVLQDHGEILKFVEADCGAEGFTIDSRAGQLVAVRWDIFGNLRELRRYDIEARA